MHFYEGEQKALIGTEESRLSTTQKSQSRPVWTQTKQLHILDCEGKILDHAVPLESTVNAQYYKEFLTSPNVLV